MVDVKPFSKNFFSEDSIQLKNLEVQCHVGCSNEERSFPQILRISVTMFLSLGIAATNDDLNETIDYAAVVNEIRKTVNSRQYNLIETVAEDIATHLLKMNRIKGLQVNVEKKVLPGLEAAMVSLWRQK